MSKANTKIADRVRDYCRVTYIEPARRRGDKSVVVVAGDVQRALHITNRNAAVCQALSGQKFLAENSLILYGQEGPASGASTTVKFQYSLGPSIAERPTVTDLLALRGVACQVYTEFGGGETYLRETRQNFYGDKQGNA